MPSQIFNSGSTVALPYMYLSAVDLDYYRSHTPSIPGGAFSQEFGSGVFIGQDIIMTAAHVFLEFGQSNPLPAATANLTLGVNDFYIGFDPLSGNNTSQTGIAFHNIGGLTSGTYNSMTNDIGIVSVPQYTLLGGGQSMLIFSDPNDASGNLWTAGYRNPSATTNGEVLWETTGTLSSGNYMDGFWNTGVNFDFEPGQSGSGVWLNYSIPGTSLPVYYLAGIVSHISASGIRNVEAIGDSYVQLANELFTILGKDPSLFATNVLIGDQGTGAASLIQGTGFYENIYVSDMVGNTVHGGGGYDTVYYTGISTGVTATINTANITVSRAGPGGTTINDTLNDISAVQGTAQADAFVIATLRQGMLVGNSNVFDPNPPQEPPDTKSATVAEVLTLPTSGGRALSSAQAMAASGLNFMLDGTEDTLTLAQSLWDAGASVTYYSAFGEGMIYLNGVQIGYTGVHFEPAQTDFFGGIPQGGSVGLTDTGTTTLDLSGVVGAITDTLLSGITLWNLVDEIEVGAGDVSLDLGALGINTYEASKLVGRRPNYLSSGQIISAEGHGNGAARSAANDNISVQLLAA